MAASHEGRVEAAQLLLASGAGKDLPDGNGWTAFMFASQAGNLEVVRLLESGANKEKNSEGAARVRG